ncbi:hypothetical protein HK099_000923 [Clydaea vesicula]|uniref:Uncharacterized protein n=1 Tax=Clydaea vesicula TaxID=447962 RepID=A0AAD5TUT7_9FUNG|nr:hypothetical protein HK099_000923 [Clydaea vesicula]
MSATVSTLITNGSTLIVLIDPTPVNASTPEVPQPTVAPPISDTPFNNNLPTILTLPSDIIPGAPAGTGNDIPSINTQTFLPPVAQTTNPDPNALAPTTIAWIVIIPLVLILLIFALIIYLRRMKMNGTTSKSPDEMSKIRERNFKSFQRRFNNSVRRVARRTNKGSTSRYSASPSDSEYADNQKSNNEEENEVIKSPRGAHIPLEKNHHSTYDLSRDSPDPSQSTYVNDYPVNHRREYSNNNRDNYYDNRDNHYDRRDNIDNDYRPKQSENRSDFRRENYFDNRSDFDRRGDNTRMSDYGDGYSQRMSDFNRDDRSRTGGDFDYFRGGRDLPRDPFGGGSNYGGSSKGGESSRARESHRPRDRDFEQSRDVYRPRDSYRPRGSDVGRDTDSFAQRMGNDSSVSGETYEGHPRNRPQESNYSGSINGGDSFRERMGLAEEDPKPYKNKYQEYTSEKDGYDYPERFENSNYKGSNYGGDRMDAVSVTSSSFTAGGTPNRKAKQSLTIIGKQNLTKLPPAKSQLSNPPSFVLENEEEERKKSGNSHEESGLKYGNRDSVAIEIGNEPKPWVNDVVSIGAGDAPKPWVNDDSGSMSDVGSNYSGDFTSRPKKGQKTKL